MSVLKKNRGISEMEFLNSAHELELFTVQRASHDIPKAYTFTLKMPLCESARAINKYLIYANSIYPQSMEDFDQRRQYQRAAVCEIQNMLAILRLTSELLPIKDAALEHWTGLLLTIERLTKRWAKSDRERAYRLYPDIN